MGLALDPGAQPGLQGGMIALERTGGQQCPVLQGENLRLVADQRDKHGIEFDRDGTGSGCGRHLEDIMPVLFQVRPVQSRPSRGRNGGSMHGEEEAPGPRRDLRRVPARHGGDPQAARPDGRRLHPQDQGAGAGIRLGERHLPVRRALHARRHRPEDARALHRGGAHRAGLFPARAQAARRRRRCAAARRAARWPRSSPR